jgi:hypothetical protein
MNGYETIHLPQLSGRLLLAKELLLQITPFDNHHQQLLTNNLHQLGFPINSLALQILSCKLQLSVTTFAF